ncbi:MAG: hemolysin family protein [Planctomycetes bacterium]|nr:hemolysin family protein [Planctomycetota bacterium]
MDGWIIWAELVVLLGLLVFSTLNLALHVPRRARLAEEFEKRGRMALFEAFVAIRPQYMLATAALRSVFVLGLLLLALLRGKTTGAAEPIVAACLAFLAVLALVLVFGVAIPNAWAKYRGEWLIVQLLPLLSIVRVLCHPITLIMQSFDPLVRRLAGAPARDPQSHADELEQEILNAVSEGELHGAVDEEEKEMIKSVIELADTHVQEIMTPRTDIAALPKDADLDTVLETIRLKGHSRIPVYDETIDTVLGVLYAKDLLSRDQDSPFAVTAIMRNVLFVPESKLVRDLLREFQSKKVHIAVILDEYGGTAGLVTIEDIIEELVGEIADEYEKSTPAPLRRIDDHSVEVDARMSIDDLNDQLGIALPEDESYETIGGFVFSAMGKVPQTGERCAHGNVGIQVIAAEPRRVLRLRLEIAAVAEDDGAAK